MLLCVVSFLGTSGQNVSDIVKYSSVDDHLEILENTLKLRHLAPTAPDTLGIKHTTHTHIKIHNGEYIPSKGELCGFCFYLLCVCRLLPVLPEGPFHPQ